ncbi:FAD-dependent oxidoreductase [Microbacterium sp. SSM24]|uniref:FAD-dependent oxidoreductase n=1 Tax=Microbacterium sp. SSM24 TaxID=2991714 RepID=UPI0022263CDE|nr:NAD(P)/FAD-dependent oxidoreductase [Microbacterium sp. SSM24]MCW3493101.1 FAD-dependent monooxygenase [Microbacterium sp. SSM24]
MPDVVVVGAGPVGTLLSSELARRGVAVTVLERRTEPGGGSRAIGVHSPVLAALEASGITERLLARAVRVSRGEARSGGRTLGVVRFDRLDRRYPFVATLPQHETEAALADGAPAPRRGAMVTGVRPVGRGIRISLEDGDDVTAPLVVVAGGWRARDLVYRPGGVHVRPYADRYLMADVAAGDGGDVAVIGIDRDGVLESFPLTGGRRRYVAWDAGAPGADRADRLRAALHDRGEHAAAERIETATAFEVRRAVAPALRRDRLFVVGDTAHEVSPIGGQGMNLGLLDAATLAPLLAAWVRAGVAPDAELARWERRRLASARTAARLASVNTSLGRPLGPFANAVRREGLRLALLPPGERMLAHAYSMGFDRDA